MKSTGIVRPLDAVGRIVLPMEIRKKLGITERNDALEIYTEGDKIILKKYAPNCVFYGSEKDVISFKGKNICKKCRGELENGI